MPNDEFMKGNLIQDKSYEFALATVHLYKKLVGEQKEFVLSKQLLRSGTSIGANVEEAIGGQSDRDFFTKMTIAYKEARETRYWLRLLHDSGYLKEEDARVLDEKCEELCRILSKIQLTLKSRLENS
ncbi:MAG: four helix bundle protein [Patescibacteria group bacterium]